MILYPAMETPGLNIVRILLQILLFVALSPNFGYALAVEAAGHQNPLRQDEHSTTYRSDTRTKRTTGGTLPDFLLNSRPPSSESTTRTNSDVRALLSQTPRGDEDPLASLLTEHRPRVLAPSSGNSPVCCVRRPKREIIGYDVTGELSIADVGVCRIRHRRKQLSASASHHRCNQCGDGGSCVPSLTRLQRVQLLSGRREVEVIVNCTCQERSSCCDRRSKHVIFMPHSPFETTVDVGSCGGPCDGDYGCKAIKNKTVAINGPNGAQLVDTIEQCGCVSACYRMSYMESIYNLTWNTTTNETQIDIKEIDVGKCAGSCETSSSSPICVMPGPDSSSCMMSLYGRTSCRPKSYNQHSYVLPNGQSHSVYAISTCLCQ